MWKWCKEGGTQTTLKMTVTVTIVNKQIMHLLLTLSTPGIIQTTQMMKNKKIKIKDKR